ncbi:MAG: sterol desaturase family protein [Chitinophagaceae bacterium]
MHLNYLAFAIPLFVGFMLLEYFLSVKRNMGTFNFKEVVANLNVGIAERLCDLFTTGLFFFFFSWIHRNFAIADIKPELLTWVLLFVLTDLVWYWYHRVGHKVNLFWSFHVVHHQSDDFNFTVAARITVFQAAARCLFWSILPLVGFPPEMITLLLLVHGTYPFFTHTQLVGRLGVLEYLFVTPSHHRVHHSSNPCYLDKNFGDVLIIWDKIFGTFAKENEVPVYGITKPLNSHSFLWQHFHFFLEMMTAFKRSKGLRKKLKCLLGKPDEIDPRIREHLERKLSIGVKENQLSETLGGYIMVKTFISLTVLFCIILLEHYLSNTQIFILAVYLILSVITTGAMLEQRRWIFHLEFFRGIALGAYLLVTFPYFNLGVLLTLILILFTSFYKSIERRYYNYLHI